MFVWIKHLFEKIFRVDKKETEVKKNEGVVLIIEKQTNEQKKEIPLTPYEVAKTQIGTLEIDGPIHNQKIINYHQATTLKATDDETAWCSSFVNWCFQEAKLDRTKSAMARSWLKIGQAISESEVKEGDVVIFWRGSKSASTGHVGFVTKIDNKYVYTLGGNQNNAVNVTKYLKDNVLGYRRFSYNN